MRVCWYKESFFFEETHLGLLQWAQVTVARTLSRANSWLLLTVFSEVEIFQTLAVHTLFVRTRLSYPMASVRSFWMFYKLHVICRKTTHFCQPSLCNDFCQNCVLFGSSMFTQCVVFSHQHRIGVYSQNFIAQVFLERIFRKLSLKLFVFQFKCSNSHTTYHGSCFSRKWVTQVAGLCECVRDWWFFSHKLCVRAEFQLRWKLLWGKWSENILADFAHFLGRFTCSIQN